MTKDKEFNKKETKIYEKALNVILRKNFGWFKKIEIDYLSIGYSKIVSRVSQIGIQGTIYVDEEWVAKQYREYHYSSTYPNINEEEISFGDIIGGDLSRELKDIFFTTFAVVLKLPLPTQISWQWLMVKYSDSEKNSLTEQIKRILREEYDSKKTRLNNFIFARFDEVFDKLKLERTDNDVYQYDWFYEDRDFVKVFERNHWGRFWIYGCEEYKELLLVKKLLSISYQEFEKILINYLNKRYDSQFEEQPLKDIGNENCYDENEEIIETELTERCWKGYTQKGMKTMFGKRYPNCVKKTKK